MITKLPYEVAIDRINAAINTKAEELDLSDLGLREFPRGIERLNSSLRSINLSRNSFRGFPIDLTLLTQLEIIDLEDNSIGFGAENKKEVSFPSQINNLKRLKVLNLADNWISGLSSEIEYFESLTNLNLNKNHLTRLPPEIGNLANLEILSIRENELRHLPTEIGDLSNLKMLDLSKNKISHISAEIGLLKKLTSLNLSHNALNDLPAEMEGLVVLNHLYLAENQITSLPKSLVNLRNLKTLHLSGNPMPIPPEIAKKSKEPNVILNYYFSSIKHLLNECKILIVGQGSVGKTSLIRRIITETFDVSETKTEGIAITHWQVPSLENNKKTNAQINLNLWDFGGQEIMHATHQFFLTKRSLYLLVLDSRLTQEENRVEYWLKIIQSFGGESPVLIVGNKIDQHPLDIDRTGLQKKYPNIVGILETSAATGAGIEELKAAIAEQVNNLPHVRDLLPETWFTVKTKLEGLGRESNFITHDKYLELCAENEVSDETSQRTLIGFLHDLGVVLHFQDDPRLEALGILNPQWVTNGVYKILNSHTLFQNKGVLTTSMLDEILNLPEYPRGKRLFIVDMMKKFELCYDIEA